VGREDVEVVLDVEELEVGDVEELEVVDVEELEVVDVEDAGDLLTAA
jgi:hypothetical protein